MACRRYIQWYISYFLSSITSDWCLAPHRWVFYITHSDAPQSVRLLWTSNQFVPETPTWQHSQQTDIHTPGGIRTHDLSRRAAAHLRIRPRDYWDRPYLVGDTNCWPTYVVCLSPSNAPLAHFGASAPSVVLPSHSRGFYTTHNDAPQSLGLLWASDQPVAETTWQHYSRHPSPTLQQTSKPPVEFEPTISAGERPQTHALFRAVTVTGTALHHGHLFCRLPFTLSPTFEVIKAQASHPGAANR
jgi:hypothetical protein